MNAHHELVPRPAFDFAGWHNLRRQRAHYLAIGRLEYAGMLPSAEDRAMRRNLAMAPADCAAEAFR